MRDEQSVWKNVWGSAGYLLSGHLPGRTVETHKTSVKMASPRANRSFEYKGTAYHVGQQLQKRTNSESAAKTFTTLG